jgi:hypothetical protein
MSSIPVSQLVQVLPGVLAPAGTLNNLNGLILTSNAAVPVGGVQSFASAAAVGAFFGLTSPEYDAAQVYFAGPTNAAKTPSSLLFAQYPTAAVGAYLRSANLAITLTQLQALTGTLTITVNGAPLTSATINLSAATSFSNAATLIQAGFTSPTFGVTYDSQRGAFVVESTATGQGEVIGYATGSLASGLSLTAATGAVLSQGAAIATPAAYMSALAGVSQNFFCFTSVFEPDTADKIAFSAWTSLQQDQYCYVGYDSDPNVTGEQGANTTWGYAVAAAADSGSCPVVGDFTHSAFVCSWAASTDYTARNGRSTLAFRQQAALVPSVSDLTSYTNLLANGYNCYGAFGLASQTYQRFQSGSVSGPYAWMDSYADQKWLRGNLTLALFNLLSTAGTIPYNQDGYSQIRAACADPINAAVNFGAIVPGVTLSASQIQSLTNAVGFDISSSLSALGYYLQIQDAAPSTRIARGSPPMTLFYTDGQSIQTLSLTALEVA